ncbi:hypothetical protein E3N88_18802 [Mikania micrantha]|uniref:SKP1-like protein n=1 Tax=Mikania micrantha TaxID=192012 RepID=A0A5N6NLF5_9ASTR|nr:hypothetical protein E3N88_18802 [Mikania micrantha]
MLKSSDGETFEVEEAVALKSQTIKHMIEDECADTSIPLHHVDSKTLSKVIEYCKKHVESTKNKDKTAEEDLKTFDSEFAEAAKGSLFDLIKMKLTFPVPTSAKEGKLLHSHLYKRESLLRKEAAACESGSCSVVEPPDYLNIKSLLHLTCQAVADMAEDIRRACNIVTALEEEACMKKPCDYLV